jgi:hypothetical protein
MAPVHRDFSSYYVVVLHHIRHVNFLVSTHTSQEYLTPCGGGLEYLHRSPYEL